MFYSETLQSPINSYNVKRLYGVNPDNDPARAALIGIYPLEEAPEGYTATHYVKEAYGYRAIPHEFSNAERESVYRVKAIGASLREFVSDCIPDWDPTVDYFAGTYVEHNGSIWQAASASTNVEPVLPEDPEEVNDDWTLVR